MFEELGMRHNNRNWNDPKGPICNYCILQIEPLKTNARCCWKEFHWSPALRGVLKILPDRSQALDSLSLPWCVTVMCSGHSPCPQVILCSSCGCIGPACVSHCFDICYNVMHRGQPCGSRLSMTTWFTYLIHPNCQFGQIRHVNQSIISGVLLTYG